MSNNELLKQMKEYVDAIERTQNDRFEHVISDQFDAVTALAYDMKIAKLKEAQNLLLDKYKQRKEQNHVGSYLN